jgi:TolA-binding protein
LVAEKGHNLGPYAKVLLAISALRNDDKAEAKRLLTELSRQFPDTDLFRNELKRLG